MARWIQSVCRTSVVAAVVAAGVIAVDTGPAGATGALQLYVDRGASGTECTQSAPCPSLQSAVDFAATTPAVIHIVKGNFLAENTEIAAGQQISIIGVGLDTVNDGDIGGGFDHRTVFTNRGSLTLTDMHVYPRHGGIEQFDGSLTLRNVVVDSGVPALAVHGGSVQIFDSGFGAYAGEDSKAITVDGGTVQLERIGAGGTIAQSAGAITIRDSYLGSPRTIATSGGRMTVTGSYLTGVNAVTVTGTGDVRVQRDTFNSEGPVRVTGAQAKATIVQSAFHTIGAATDGIITSADGALVMMAATALDGGTLKACKGTVLDGGYNSAFDTSCSFTESTSRSSLAGVLRHPAQPGVAPGDYGPVDPDPFAEDPPQVNPLVDAIPVGARASFDPAIELCASGSADERGQVRPVGKGCDIGAVELAPVTVHISVERTHLHTDEIAVVHASVSLASTAVAQPLKGSIEFGFSAAKRCRSVRVNGPTTATCRYHMVPEYKDASVTFVADGPTRSTRVIKPIQVDRAPLRVGISAPSSVRRGHRVTVGVSVRNDATDTPLQSYAYLYFRTAKRDWYRVTHVVTGKDGRASYTFTPGRNVLFQWRIVANSYYGRGVSRSVHTTVR